MRETSDAKLVKLMIIVFSASVGPASVLTQMASEGFPLLVYLSISFVFPIQVLLSTAHAITLVLNERKSVRLQITGLNKGQEKKTKWDKEERQKKKTVVE